MLTTMAMNWRQAKNPTGDPLRQRRGQRQLSTQGVRSPVYRPTNEGLFLGSHIPIPNPLLRPCPIISASDCPALRFGIPGKPNPPFRTGSCLPSRKDKLPNLGRWSCSSASGNQRTRSWKERPAQLTGGATGYA